MYDFDSGNIYSVEVSSGFSIGFYGLFSDSPGYFWNFFINWIVWLLIWFLITVSSQKDLRFPLLLLLRVYVKFSKFSTTILLINELNGFPAHASVFLFQSENGKKQEAATFHKLDLCYTKAYSPKIAIFLFTLNNGQAYLSNKKVWPLLSKQ